MTDATVTTIGTKLSLRDHLGAFRMRIGAGRERYRVVPGLYNVGTPDRTSPVFVSANYKMSFDSLRKELSNMNAWILVLNTRGVNVWCAAGKKTFSMDEIVRMVKGSELEKFVSHRELILPQLSAPGVSAHDVMKKSGFKVSFGPVRAGDIKRFMDNGKKADDKMRGVTFSLWERLILTPREITSRVTVSFYIVSAIFAISSLSSDFFSLQGTLIRGLFGTTAYLIGLFSGAVVTPMLLPWIPVRYFSLKGAATGLVLGFLFCLFCHEQLGSGAIAAVLLFTASVSSYTALTFTGSTPFTSPTGVEKEMRYAIPLQVIAVVLSCGLWMGNNFFGGAI